MNRRQPQNVRTSSQTAKIRTRISIQRNATTNYFRTVAKKSSCVFSFFLRQESVIILWPSESIQISANYLVKWITDIGQAPLLPKGLLESHSTVKNDEMFLIFIILFNLFIKNQSTYSYKHLYHPILYVPLQEY